MIIIKVRPGKNYIHFEVHLYHRGILVLNLNTITAYKIYVNMHFNRPDGPPLINISQ